MMLTAFLSLVLAGHTQEGVFYLAGGDINAFKSTLLNSANEKKPIEEIYPKFLEWSVSKGATNTDWYK